MGTQWVAILQYLRTDNPESNDSKCRDGNKLDRRAGNLAGFSWVAGGWGRLLEAAKVAAAGQQHPALVAAGASIPHTLLLPDCSAVVHHGGAGTSAAALTAGLPHIVCPFHFDQFFWVNHPHLNSDHW